MLQYLSEWCLFNLLLHLRLSFFCIYISQPLPGWLFRSLFPREVIISTIHSVWTPGEVNKYTRILSLLADSKKSSSIPYIISLHSGRSRGVEVGVAFIHINGWLFISFLMNFFWIGRKMSWNYRKRKMKTKMNPKVYLIINSNLMYLIKWKSLLYCVRLPGDMTWHANSKPRQRRDEENNPISAMKSGTSFLSVMWLNFYLLTRGSPSLNEWILTMKWLNVDKLCTDTTFYLADRWFSMTRRVGRRWVSLMIIVCIQCC